MDQLIFASLSHAHYWYEVGMLKVVGLGVSVGVFVTSTDWASTIQNKRDIRGGANPVHIKSDPFFFFFFFFFNLTYSRWTSSLPSCLWSLRIFPSLPGSRLTIFYRDASSALLQLVNQWLNFTSSRSHAFRYERKNTHPTLVRTELMTSTLAGVQVTY